MGKIGVVTVTFNSGKVLDGFMRSILNQTYQEWVLYVVDNHSQDNTLALLSTFPNSQMSVIKNLVNYGYAKGSNQGIEAALSDQCDHILLLNNDTEFDAALFGVLLEEMLSNKADIIAPKIRYFGTDNKIWSAGGEFMRFHNMIPLHTGEGETDTGQYDVSRFCTYVSACCALISRQTMVEVGLMDEKYFVYIEDVDWMYRARQLNKSIYYTANATLFHKASSLTGGQAGIFATTMCRRNTVYFLRKHSKNKIAKVVVLLEYFARSYIRQSLSLLYRQLTWQQFRLTVKALNDGLRL